MPKRFLIFTFQRSTTSWSFSCGPLTLCRLKTNIYSIPPALILSWHAWPKGCRLLRIPIW